MLITVDGMQIDLAPGMTVRHAILARYGSLFDSIIVSDQWGNQVGLDGELQENSILQTSRRETAHA